MSMNRPTLPTPQVPAGPRPVGLDGPATLALIQKLENERYAESVRRAEAEAKVLKLGYWLRESLKYPSNRTFAANVRRVLEESTP